jgi:glycosyltransferase involved in cell wall biosynthesis
MSFIDTISVIIPTYNSSQYINEAIRSVLCQTYKNLEIIVIDDGSTDNTRDILGPLIDQELIRYTYQKNQGPGGARNTGINMATGEYIAFLDADDLWPSHKLQLQFTFLKSNANIGMVFGDFSSFDDHGSVSKSFFEEKSILKKIPTQEYSPSHKAFSRKIFNDLIDENFIPTSTVMVKKSVFKRTGLFDSQLRSVEDLDLWLRISLKYDIAFTYERLAFKRKHGSNISSNLRLASESELMVMKKMLSICHNNHSNSVQLIKKKIGNCYFNIGYGLFCENNRTTARKYFLRSIQYKHYLFKSYVYYLACLLPSNSVATIKQLKRKLFTHG